MHNRVSGSEMFSSDGIQFRVSLLQFAKWIEGGWHTNVFGNVQVRYLSRCCRSRHQTNQMLFTPTVVRAAVFCGGRVVGESRARRDGKRHVARRIDRCVCVAPTRQRRSFGLRAKSPTHLTVVLANTVARDILQQRAAAAVVFLRQSAAEPARARWTLGVRRRALPRTLWL